ncbi:hypothetical protein F2Q70_00020574 [Brassica cretica]|uniref:Phosphatidylinositol-specific phospholipase C X domain-containing protein n=1 Tax=Brassica cretica TaxID=69181 RepID=A0A8S9GLF0_BRACR|nr:hypothetical protein F2Q70_00020574 [Brassica cretica]
MQNQSLEEEITERETAGIVTTRAIDDPAHNTFHLHAPALNRRKPYTFEEENLNCGQEAKTHRDTKMLTETFGDMLFAPPLGECLKELPSPEFLKKRILMSTKPPKEYKESKHEHVVKKDGDVDEDDDEEDDDEVHKVKKSEPRNTSFSI